VLLFDPPDSWKLARHHWAWLFSCLIIGVLALGAYGATWYSAGEQPPASSAVGLVTGIAAGLLMLYLFSYALRKLAPFRALFSKLTTNFWLRQHVWLGLLTVPLAVAHGARITAWGPLTTSLVVVYFGVILSGVWGIYRQQFVPTRLLEEIPDETIRSEIPHLSERLRQEAELLVLATCGPVKDEKGQIVIPPALTHHRNLIKNAAVHPGKVAGVLAAMPMQPIPGCEPLRQYFDDVVNPYLNPRLAGHGTTFLRARMDQGFNDLKGRLPKQAHEVIEALQSVCDQRRQFEEQEDLHSKLHAWVSFHLVLSTVLVVLLVSHIFTAPFYW